MAPLALNLGQGAVIILLLVVQFPLIFPSNLFQLSLKNFKTILFVCVTWFTIFVYPGTRGKGKWGCIGEVQTNTYMKSQVE